MSLPDSACPAANTAPPTAARSSHSSELVARAPEIRRQPRPVEVHVHRQGVGGRVVAQPPLLAADLGQRHPQPAELPGHGHLQVARRPKLLEVLGEEPVLLVVAGGPLLKAEQHLVRERGGLRRERDPDISGGLDGPRLGLCRHASLLMGALTA